MTSCIYALINSCIYSMNSTIYFIFGLFYKVGKYTAIKFDDQIIFIMVSIVTRLTWNVEPIFTDGQKGSF